jgi:O-antigen ligase
MPRLSRSMVAPVYLLACLVAGGSAQGVWQNALLQLAGLAIIACSALAKGEEELSAAARIPLILAIFLIAWTALQAIPLPVVWLGDGVRGRIGEDLALLGQPVRVLPLSVAPYSSQAALLCLIPPLAMYCAIVRMWAYRPSWLAVALITAAMAGILLGALQVASGNPSGRWYLYRDTNIGAAVGFFANANHMAMLLVVSLPFLAALGSDERGREGQRYWGLLAILGGVVTVLIAGILLNGSLAGLALTLPVLLASAAIMLSASGWLRRGLLLAAGGLLALAIAAIANSSIGPAKIDLGARTSVASRAEILRTTGSAIGDFMPFGSGLGTFAKVYPLYESPDSVTSEFVVHAHNDYAEVALELGIPGVLLVIAFLGWWLTLVRRAWDQGDAYARAASVASAAILCHSLVDFPLRTAAMAAVFATCMGLLVDRRQQRVPAMIPELRPARHIVIG